MARWEWRVRRHAYRSSVDGSREPFRVYMPTGYRRLTSCPLVVLLHGFGGDEKGAINERTAGLADEHGYLLLSARGRGGTFYDGVAEGDFFETFRRVKARYRVDEDRVYLMGTSMGGTGAWRLACRYPHLFAAVAPVCGWTDWRLWYRHWYAAADQPIQVEPWRLPLIERASTLPLAENLTHVPVCVLHGARDTTVLIDNSRRMVAALRRYGVDVTYKEYARGKHSGFRSRWDAVFDWFDGRSLRSWQDGRSVGPASPPGAKRRVVAPRRVVYVTNSPAHGQAYWVRIDRLVDPNALGRIEAVATEDGVIRVSARNIDALTLSCPFDDVTRVRVGRSTLGLNGREMTLRRSRGRWSVVGEPRAESGPNKADGLPGPIADAFRSPFVLVAGGAPEDRAEADFFAQRWQRWMMPSDDRGRPRGMCAAIDHTHVRARHVAESNLICFGRPHTHRILSRIADRLPARIDRRGVSVGGHAYHGRSIGLRLICPNPLNPRRYVVVWFGHMRTRSKDLEGWPWLLPDYAVFDGDTPCGRTTHPYWDRYDRLVADGEIDPATADEDDKPPAYLPDGFLDAGFFDAHWKGVVR